MKIKTIIIVMGMLLPVLSIRAQWEKANTFPVMHTILPNIPLAKVLNWKDSTTTLYDFKDKLVLIDFWNTHCGACIKHFKELDSIQREYSDRLQIIMSTRNSKADVARFLQTWQQNNNIQLSMPFVVEDSTLYGLFPYYYQPAYVWISPRHRLIAKTIVDYVDRNVIDHILSSLSHSEL